MPIAPTYPGVYVAEVPSGVRTISGVSTSTALFLGRAKNGPMFSPTLCLNYTDFERAFSSDPSVGELPRQLRLFFLNGGGRAWVTRVANGATNAEVTLLTEGTSGSGKAVLKLKAKYAGLVGENVRASVTYAGLQPEVTFNVELFRWDTEGGRRVAKDPEVFRNLSMDPNSPLYAPAVISQNSKLVDAEPGADIASMAPVNGFSQSGRFVPYDSSSATSFRDAWAAILGDAAITLGNKFEISVDGNPYVPVNLSAVTVGSSAATLGSDIASAITQAYATAGVPGLSVSVDFSDGPAPGEPAPIDKTSVLRISSSAKGNVFVRPAGSADLSVPLMLGTAQGGLEVGAFAGFRPAASGPVFNLLSATNYFDFAAALQKDVSSLAIQCVAPDGTLSTETVTFSLKTSNPAGDKPMFRDSSGGFDGVREKLRLLGEALELTLSSNRNFSYRAEVWGGRLALRPRRGADNFAPAVLSTGATDIGPSFNLNTVAYSVGASGLGGYQVPAVGVASDGLPPLLSDYEAAFKIIDREVDLFNLMVLPPDDPNAAPQIAFPDLWGPASVFCQKRRALLLMDAPSSWDSAQKAIQNVDALRVGLVKDFAALYYPRLVVSDQGRKVALGPSGAIAGLMARIDTSRGVWKAPAGTEADLRGVVGVERAFSDDENGVLNPKAINTLRTFPQGVVCWGARTMDGDDAFGSDYKYVPIRRLALYIEESLYRGLRWVVFEPNDEPLWSQIRLNLGAFMNDLFRQGAFQGTRPRDAYFVKCDAETTTQNDRNLGIVNIWVGFAPLKPAEFVVLYLQQIAGQIQA